MSKGFLLNSVIVMGLIIASCQPGNDHVAFENNSPEGILKLYQKHFDQNDFESAKKLSTEAGKQWLTDIEPMIVNEFSIDSSILTTVFNKLECSINQDTAICICELEDENESYNATYKLLKIKGKWLVDAPDEGETIEYEDEKEVIDAFFN